MIAWNLGTQQARADAANAGSGSGSSWWDMKCVSPVDGNEREFVTLIMPPQGDLPELTFELSLESLKIADLPNDGGYNDIAFTHDFTFKVTTTSEQSSLSGYNTFDSQCYLDSGEIDTAYSSSGSDPHGDSTLSGTATLGAFISYSVDIYIVRSASISSAQTQIFANVTWQDKFDSNIHGSFTLPDSGVLNMINNFEATSHP